MLGPKCEELSVYATGRGGKAVTSSVGASGTKRRQITAPQHKMEIAPTTMHGCGGGSSSAQAKLLDPHDPVLADSSLPGHVHSFSLLPPPSWWRRHPVSTLYYSMPEGLELVGLR